MQAESCPLSVAIGRSLPSRNLPSIWEGGRDSKQKVEGEKSWKVPRWKIGKKASEC